MQIRVVAKRMFFDRPAVKRQVDKDTLRFLRTAGGYGRKVARSGMKRRGKARATPKNMNGKAYAKWLDEVKNQPASQPGTPPFVHSDDPNRTLKKIEFYFVSKRAVIIGALILQTVKQFASNATPVTKLHEKGGEQLITEKLASVTTEETAGPPGRDSRGKFTKGQRKTVKQTKWIPLNGRARPGQPVRRRMAKYPPRPFMAPAKEKTRKRFKNLWFGSESGV